MSNAWLETRSLPHSPEFDDFLALYKAHLAGKSENPEKLYLRIRRTWNNLSMKQKRDFTQQLLESGSLDFETSLALKIFNGTIIEFADFNETPQKGVTHV